MGFFSWVNEKGTEKRGGEGPAFPQWDTAEPSTGKKKWAIVLKKEKGVRKLNSASPEGGGGKKKHLSLLGGGEKRWAAKTTLTLDTKEGGKERRKEEDKIECTPLFLTGGKDAI